MKFEIPKTQTITIITLNKTELVYQIKSILNNVSNAYRISAPDDCEVHLKFASDKLESLLNELVNEQEFDEYTG